MTNATLEQIPRNVADVRMRIAEAATRTGRDPASIRLVAVSKSRPAAAIAAAQAGGQLEFGENYLQEALPKLDTLAAERALVWHFIGALQANKTRAVAERFAWVHTVDRERIARRLSERRPETLSPLNVCIEVNMCAESTRNGVTPERLPALADMVADLPRLRLRGLMCIPVPARDFATPRASFRQLRHLLELLNARGHALDTLSMGMSGDFEAAIAEGATLVRVGTAIFGTRIARHT